MRKLLLLVMFAAIPALAQFSNASKLQGKPICNPLTTTSAYVLTWNASTGCLDLEAASSGGTPGGSTTQCQYNNAGSFGGITGCTTNGTAVTLVGAALGTPTALVLTNATGLPAASILPGTFGAGDYTVNGNLLVGTSLSVDSSTGIATTSKIGNAALSLLTGAGKWLNGVPVGQASCSDLADASTTCATAGANRALSNLASVSINAVLGFQTGIAVGNTTNPAKNIVFNASGTYGTGSYTYAGTPTANRTITLADADMTMLYSGGPGGTPSSLTGTNITGIPATGVTGTALTLLTTANVLQAPNACVDAGSTDAYACNLSPAIGAYQVGVQYSFKANTSNTTAATIALNGLAALPIVKSFGTNTGTSFSISLALDNGDIQAGKWVTCIYDGTNCQMTSYSGYYGASGGISSSVGFTFGGARNAGSGGVSDTLSTANSGALYRGVMNSGGTDWTNGLARAGYLMAQSSFQFGAGNSNLTHTVFTNGNEQIHTGAPSDAGGSQRFQVIGGIGTQGEIITGTRFTCTGDGCTPVAGGATGGTFTVTTTGAAAPVVTMGGTTFTAPAGFVCTANNQTTANLIRQSASSTTTATFAGVTVSGDTIEFHCHAY